MAFRFNAILDFNAKRAIKNMKLTKKEMQKLRDGGKRLSKGFGQLSQGAQGMTFATAPLALAIGGAVREAASFEAQMSTVRSVLLATPEAMIPLEKLTKRLGATTVFTAQQAGEGAENLSRAGFTIQQTMAALPGVLDAAAASGVGLAEASNVVASNIGAFGLKAGDATRVADILAITTARTNTNFTQLGEGLKLAAPIAAQAGLSLAATASALGVFANAGVKGTLGATALRSAINKLAKPTKASIELFGGKKGMTAAMIEVGKNGKTQLKPMEVIMANVAKAVQSSANPLEAAGKAAEIFGIRGTTAFGSFQKQLTKTIPITKANEAAIRAGAKRTGENIDEFLIKGVIPKLVALRLEINGAAGSAKAMAAIRLDNLQGQFTLFKSALSGFGIEVGGLMTGPLRSGLKVVTDSLSGVVAGFQLLNASGEKETGELQKQMEAAFGVDGAKNVQEFIAGFIDGIKSVVASVKVGFEQARSFLAPFFKDGEVSAKSMGELAAKILLVGAIAAPIFAAITAALFVLGPIVTGITGIFNVLVGAFVVLKIITIFLFSKILLPLLAAVLSPIGLIVAAVIGVIALIVIFRKEIVAFSIKAIAVMGQFWNFLISRGPAAIDLVRKDFSDLIKGATVLWDGFSGFMATLWTGLAKGATALFNSMKDSTVAFFVETANGWIKWKNDAINAATGVWTSLKSGATGLWLSIKASFINPMINAVTGLPDLVTTKINSAKNFLKDNVPGASFFFGDDEEKRTGTAGDEISKGDVNAGTESAKILNESLRQKKVLAPTSANDIGQSVGKSVSSIAGGGGGGGANVNVTVGVTGKISGRDLNLVVTRQQVEVAEKNGIQTNPNAKRRVKQNGQMLTGTGT